MTPEQIDSAAKEIASWYECPNGYFMRTQKIASILRKHSASEVRELPDAVLKVCHARNWSLHWTARGAILHLEASELIEAIRGKHGDPKDEAADVLFVLMSITEHAGIPWNDVVAQAWSNVRELQSKPPYAGEERCSPPPAQESVPSDIGERLEKMSDKEYAELVQAVEATPTPQAAEAELAGAVKAFKTAADSGQVLGICPHKSTNGENDNA